MTTVQSIGGTGGSTPAAGAGSVVTADEQQDRFMKLLVAQMRNQDPLNPLDNAQVTTQMAQISTVSGIDKLNSALAGMSSSFLAAQSLQAAGMIGHGVLAGGSKLALENGAALGGVELPDPADQVTVTILDGAGNSVHRQNLGALPAGVAAFRWDGATDSGGKAADGIYTLEVKALRGGEKIAANPLVSGQVKSVSLGAGETALNVDGLGSVGLNQVKQIL